MSKIPHSEEILNLRIAKFKNIIEVAKLEDYPNPHVVGIFENITSAIKPLVDEIVKARTDWTQAEEKHALFVSNAVTTADHQNAIKELKYHENEFRKTHIGYCNEVDEYLNDYFPFIGKTVRSKDYQNNLEAQKPLNYFIKKYNILYELILTYDWSHEVTTLVSKGTILKNYIFVTLPASYARDVLLLPVFAHEFAHTLWADATLEKNYKKDIKNNISSQIKTRDNLSDIEYNKLSLDRKLKIDNEIKSLENEAMLLVEEVFCDLYATALFGEAYLYAFERAVSPYGDTRVARYPFIGDRLEIIQNFCYPLPKQPLDKQWTNTFQVLQKTNNFKEIDIALKESLASLKREATYEASRANIYDENDVQSIYENMMAWTPPKDPKSPVNIIRAAWQVYNEKKYNPKPSERIDDLEKQINNMCLKALEIWEFNNSQGELK